MTTDHFSKQSEAYKKYRPTYPAELFKYLSSLCRETKLAWDCATGSGQAAVDLAHYFQNVVATDISENQLKLAPPHKQIQFLLGSAETCAHLKDSSCDLVAVAQAYHWFDEVKFLSEAKRVLKPEGILAIWNYDWASIEPELDNILTAFGKGLLRKYWPAEVQKRAHPDRILPEGFEILNPPAFSLEAKWTYPHLRGYLESWSATQIYKAQNEGKDPFAEIESELKAAWGDEERVRKISWPLHLLVARKAASLSKGAVD